MNMNLKPPLKTVFTPHIEGVKIVGLQFVGDKRGGTLEMFRSDSSGPLPEKFPLEMGYISFTMPGQIRGPHEHEEQTDYFVFVGPGVFTVHLWDGRLPKLKERLASHEVYNIGENLPAIVIIPPGVVHGYKCISPHKGYTMNFPDKLYRGINKAEEVDEIRWESKPENPYVIE